MRLAIFDIDGTLVAGASTEKRFFLHLLRSGKQSPRQILAFVAFLVRWFPRYGRRTLKKDKAYLTGLDPEELRRFAGPWVESALARAWVRPCIERLRLHQENGDAVALVSGTPDFIAEAIGRYLGVELVVGTVCAKQGGRLLPAPPVSHPFAESKLEVFTQLARQCGVSLADVVAYGDSIHDLPVFLASGEAVAVRPDRGLAAAAERHGWEVLCPAGGLRLALPRPFQAS